MKRFLLTVLAGFAAFPLAFAQSETVVVEPFLGGGLAIGIPGGDAALAYGVSEGGKDETRIDDRSVETCILVCVVISRYV